MSYLLELKRDLAILQLKIANEELRRKRSRSRSRSRSPSRRKRKQLYVTNIHLEPALHGLTGADLELALKQIFEQYGRVEDVFTNTNITRVWASITFSSEEARDYCLDHYVGELSCSKQK